MAYPGSIPIILKRFHLLFYAIIHFDILLYHTYIFKAIIFFVNYTAKNDMDKNFFML